MNRITLWQGDCLQMMRNIPDKSVDMVLCDLPYATTQNKWDIAIPMPLLWDQYSRICKRNAAIVLFGQMPFSASLVMSNPKDFRYEWIWEKSKATGFLNAKKMPMKTHENILVFYKALPTYNPQYEIGKPYTRGMRDPATSNYGKTIPTFVESKDGRRYPRDIIKFQNSKISSKHGTHPTQKPVPLLEYLVKTYTKENNVVLDNCMGSGSTGVACVNTDRRFIGIELDETYFKTADLRIHEALSQRYGHADSEIREDGLSLFDD